MQTRSQIYSKKVFGQIDDLSFTVNENNEEKRLKKIKALKKEYGSLCHNFPLMVLRNGLSQAVAFVWMKSENDLNSPQGKFIKHLSLLTDGSETETAKDFQERINQLDLMKYQRITRKILSASIWYKRFAESLLGVEAGNSIEDDNND